MIACMHSMPVMPRSSAPRSSTVDILPNRTRGSAGSARLYTYIRIRSCVYPTDTLLFFFFFLTPEAVAMSVLVYVLYVTIEQGMMHSMTHKL